MSGYSKYKSIAVIDVTREEKRRRNLLLFDIMPIWRWLWCQLNKINLTLDFIEINFGTNDYFKYQKKKYDLILVYIDHFIPVWLSNYLMEIKVKERETSIFFCGYLPTVVPDKIENLFPVIDCILFGPLEISLTQFCEKLYDIFVTNEYLLPKSFCDFPKENNVTEKKLEYKEFFRESVGILQTSSGCPKTCSFCRYSEFYHQFYNNVYTQYSFKEIVSEMKTLKEQYNIHYFRIVDSNFLGAGKLVYSRAQEFAEIIKKNTLEICFGIHCRSDSINHEVVETLSSVGLKYVSIGIESMSDEQLNRFGKQETINEHWNAVNLLHAHKINVLGYAILADPLITRAELIANINGLYELSKIIQIVINEKMILYTTTKYYKKYKEQINNLQEIGESLGVVLEYGFNDEWCKNFYEYIEQTSVWLHQVINKEYYKRKQECNQESISNYIQRATIYRIEALKRIVDNDEPNDETVEIIKKNTLEKIINMR